MTSGSGDDSRNKFKQAFKLFGEAAGEVLKHGVDRVRRPGPTAVTEDMRRAGAEILRQHRVDTLIRDAPEPNRYLDNEAPMEPGSVLIDRTLRDIATEVYTAMQTAAERPAGTTGTGTTGTGTGTTGTSGTGARTYAATEPPPSGST